MVNVDRYILYLLHCECVDEREIPALLKKCKDGNIKTINATARLSPPNSTSHEKICTSN